jgi:hypothetical protein
LVVFEDLAFLVVVVPFFVLVDVLDLAVSEEAGAAGAGAGAGLASWAKAAKDVARTSALMRFFMGKRLLRLLGERG